MTDFYAFVDEDGTIPTVLVSSSPAGPNIPMLMMLVASGNNVKSLIDTVKALREMHPERWRKHFRLYSFSRGQEIPNWENML